MGKSSEPEDALEQLREILLGDTRRDLEHRFTRSESHSAARVTELQQEARRRIEMSEIHLEKEAELLSKRVEREAIETKETLRALTREHRETTASVEQRIAKIEEMIARSQHELRRELLAQAKTFLDELHAMREELMTSIARELGALDHHPAEESPRELGATHRSP